VAPRRFLSCTRRRRARYIERFAAMYDLVTEFVCEHIMADFRRRPLLYFRKFSVVSQSPVAGFTSHRLCWSARTSLPSKKITRTATTSRTLFVAWVCYCCLVHKHWLPDMPNAHIWCCVFMLLHWVDSDYFTYKITCRAYA